MAAATRRAMLAATVTAAAAAPVLPERAKWDRRLKCYTILKALADADDKFGLLAEACEVGAAARYQMEADHGTWARAVAHPVAGKQCEAICEAEYAASDAHYRDYIIPADKAAILLALTPAPDVEAAVFKIAMIKEESLDNHAWLKRHPMEIVREDMARLRRGEVR
ncbi:hypothetical protein U1839_05970 [Sphingomonas sp. RT2P30]|uniref:hypothetical protein n=1 Tax=Parasphingomonas halimpatiens TaxID=3096162 RepID=UPI002FCB2D73